MKKFKRLINSDNNNKHILKDTLIIIGNGFDRWQWLDTSYDAFRQYYLLHRDEIMKKLHIRKKEIRYSNKCIEEFSDVELIYGDPFHPSELGKLFWGDFESSLSKIDDQQLNLFFGKERSDLKEIKRSIKNAKIILTTAFCDWITSIEVNKQIPEYKFGDKCIVINFNYTDTLVKRFGISPSIEYHIHGQASDKSSIVFGHSSHPEYPMSALYEFGGRFRGAFFIDYLLYETDKHVQDHIQELAMFLALHSVMPENIKHVYVLGHSMSPVDIEYFQFLISISSTKPPVTDTSFDKDSTDNARFYVTNGLYCFSSRSYF